jgi:hypothetical protein
MLLMHILDSVYINLESANQITERSQEITKEFSI